MELATSLAFQLDYGTIFRAIIFSNIYALLALGLNLTYITTKIPSFAHGDLATVGAYVGYFTMVMLLGSTGLIYFSLPLVFLITGAVAVLVYIAVFKPLIRRGANVVTLMIASFGVHFVLFASIAIVADYVQNVYNILTRNILLTKWEFIWPGTDFLTSSLVNTTLALVVVTSSLYILLYRTKFGIVMRASIDNLYLAKAVGINVENVFTVAWFLIGGVTGVAGIYMAMFFPLTEELGWLRLALIFVTSIVGGLSNIYGAVLGGYVVGLSSVLGASYVLAPLGIPIEYQFIIPLAMVIIILLFAPEGLAGIVAKILRK